MHISQGTHSYGLLSTFVDQHSKAVTLTNHIAGVECSSSGIEFTTFRIDFLPRSQEEADYPVWNSRQGPSDLDMILIF